MPTTIQHVNVVQYIGPDDFDMLANFINEYRVECWPKIVGHSFFLHQHVRMADSQKKPSSFYANRLKSGDGNKWENK